VSSLTSGLPVGCWGLVSLGAAAAGADAAFAGPEAAAAGADAVLAGADAALEGVGADAAGSGTGAACAIAIPVHITATWAVASEMAVL